MALRGKAIILAVISYAGILGTSMANPYSEKEYEAEELKMAEDLISKPQHKAIVIKNFSADDYKKCYPFTALGERMAADGKLDASNKAAISGLEELGAISMAWSVVGGTNKEELKTIQQSALALFKNDPKSYTDANMADCSKKSASIITLIMEGKGGKSAHKK